METPVINIENFRQWIDSKKDGEVIGLKASCGKCPIASYLNENFPIGGYKHWLVNGKHYYPIADIAANISLLPEWAQEFVIVLDNLKTKDNYVTKKHCLTVLNTINL
jgi:hypothetical protein